MSKQDFEFYEDIGAHDSGKLPILMAMLAPIYRQDTKVTFVYRSKAVAFPEKRKQEIFVNKFIFRICNTKGCWQDLEFRRK